MDMKDSEVLYIYTIINKIPSGVTVSDEKGHFEIFNERMQEITGYTIEEANSQQDFAGLLYPEPEERQEALGRLSKVMASKEPISVETTIQAKDGSRKTLLVSTFMIRHDNRNIFLSVYTDITERKKQEEELRASEQKCTSVIRTSLDGFWIVDTKGCILEVNEAYCRMTGYAREELLNKCIPDIDTEETPDKISQQIQKVIKTGYARFESRHKCKDGKVIDVEISANYTEVRGEGLFFTFIRDITQRKWFENELQQLALKDSHTGLFNHRYLKEALDAASSRAKRQFSPLSVIMMDIDYFKSINDVYGHVFGDLVLKQFAEQLKKTVRAYDVVIRYGGEEFVIISSDTDRENAQILAKRILDKINLYNFGDKKHVVKLKISLAVASYPEDAAECGIDLVRCADQILGKVKEGGGNRVFSYQDLRKEGKIITEKPSVHNLKQKIDKLTRRANQGLIEAIFAFAKTIEMKDHYTGEHVEKSVHYATRMAEELNLPKDNIELIKQASMLHDLGKVGISEKILLKKSRLNKKEFQEIKRHPQIGADILRPIQSLRQIIPFVFHHHERWDGKGYPYGLKKERIPLGARIIAIADVYQALVSHRPYRKAYTKKEAMRMIKEGAGNHFDPEIVKVFVKILEEEK